MASAFSHIAIPIAIRLAAGKSKISWRLLILAFIFSIAPDFDAIAFKIGIPYESQWGHRGFTHSIVFAVLISFVPTFFADFFKSSRLIIYITCVISMLSHGVLDACTNGGLGVAFLWPFDSSRYFFPWQGIEVSPITVSKFFTARGVAVLTSELFYVWLPCIFIGGICSFVKKIKG